MSESEQNLFATASGHARQVNFRGDNFGPINFFSPGRPPMAVHQLPLSPEDFVGRKSEIGRILAWHRSGPIPIVVNIYGMPATGKSALAIRIANQLSGDSDCEVYLDLRTRDGNPLDPDDALAGLLTTFGIPATEIPTGLALRASALRSMLHGQNSLIILDNASNSDQVEWLLPGRSKSTVLITSWHALSELPGVIMLPLRELDDREAMRVLTAMTGLRPRSQDRKYIAEIIRYCAGLPLALRIAGGLMKARPHWSWADLASRLRDEADRLNRFQSGNLAVRASFQLAYSGLSPETAQTLRMVALAPSTEISSGLARLLVENKHLPADDILDDLVTRQFLQRMGPTSYRMHDLLWLFARELVYSVETDKSRQVVLARMTKWSYDQIEKDYLPKFISSQSSIPWLSGSPMFSLVGDYVETLVSSLTADKQPRHVSDVFPSKRKRVMLVASGGTGKSTLVNHLCHSIAVSSDPKAGPKIPFVLPAREVRPGDLEEDLESFIIRLVQHRYGFQLTNDVLRLVLRGPRAVVVIDGLDELIDPNLKRWLVTSISSFCERYYGVALLVTSRHYTGIENEFRQFDFFTLIPWSDIEIDEYLRKVSSRLELQSSRELSYRFMNMLDDRRLREIARTPLGVQMLALAYTLYGEVPANETLLVERIVEEIVFERERSRGTLYISPPVLRSILEFVAFRMQSDPVNRILITRSALQDSIACVMEDEGDEYGLDDSGRLLGEVRRAAILSEVGVTAQGEPVFAFSHTAFREHMAGSYLASSNASSPDAMLEAILERLGDASWEAALTAALVLANVRNRDYIDRVDLLAMKYEDERVSQLLLRAVG